MYNERNREQRELERRRCAVRRGLADFVDAEHLDHLLELWEARYSGGARFNLQEFADEVSRHADIVHQRKDLYLRLVASMSSPCGPNAAMNVRNRVNRNEPVSRDAAAGTTEGITGYDVTAANRVGRVLLKSFFHTLRDIDQRSEHDLRLALRVAPGSGANPAPARTLAQWFASDFENDTTRLSAGQLAAMIHRAYVSACDHYPPAAVDRALTGGVRAAEQLTESRRFSPRQLL